MNEQLTEDQPQPETLKAHFDPLDPNETVVDRQVRYRRDHEALEGDSERTGDANIRKIGDEILEHANSFGQEAQDILEPQAREEMERELAQRKAS